MRMASKAVLFGVLLIVGVAVARGADPRGWGYAWILKGQILDAAGRRSCPVVRIRERGFISKVEGNVREFFLSSGSVSTIPVKTDSAVGMVLEAGDYSVMPNPKTIDAKRHGPTYGGVIVYVAPKGPARK
jgi:hypothetical protein